jgi:hypothetical protein
VNDLWHPDFDKNINGYSLRGIALNTERFSLETKWDKRLKRFKTGCIIVLITLSFVVSAFTVGKWLAWDTGYKYAIKSIYSGNAKQVEANKQKAYKKLDIAGAGDNTRQTGNGRGWEGKDSK